MEVEIAVFESAGGGRYPARSVKEVPGGVFALGCQVQPEWHRHLAGFDDCIPTPVDLVPGRVSRGHGHRRQQRGKRHNRRLWRRETCCILGHEKESILETLFRTSLTKAFLPVLGLAILTAVDGDAQNLSKHNRAFSPSSPASLRSQPTVSTDDLTSPAAVPCVVSLFNNYTFNSYSSQSFTYTPTCPGPWSKVLFKGSFNVSAGVQFDRTANIQLGYVNIYFGTTEEPSSTSAPSWKVQRDLTDYSSSVCRAPIRRSRYLQHRRLHLHRRHLRHGDP